MSQVEKVDQVEIMRSFVAGRYLRTVVAERYDLGEIESCKLFSKLLRTQDNDHYLVTTADNREFVLRVYQNGDTLGRVESDYLFELDWLLYLKENGISVSYPIPLKSGRYLGALDAPEGTRYIAMFTIANGEKMTRFDNDHLFSLGQHMAKVHVISNDYTPKYERYTTDLDYLVDQPLRRIRDFWGEDRVDELDLLLVSASEHKAKIKRLLGEPGKTKGDVWGIIGGDFHNANARMNENGQPTFFNFDLCGYGYRAYDIAVVLANTDIHKSVDQSEAFFAGYYSVRPLSEAEHQAIESFMTIRRIWLMGSFAIDEGLAGHTFVAPA